MQNLVDAITVNACTFSRLCAVDCVQSIGPNRTSVPYKKMSCSICVEKFNEKTKKPLACYFCKIEVCISCLKKCALTWASAPKCAGCNKAFTTDQLDSMFSRGFRRGPLRIQAIQNLQEQETSLLPDTMHILEQRIKQNTYIQCINEIQSVLAIFSSQPLNDFPITQIVSIQERLRKTGIQDLRSTKKRREMTERSVKCPKDTCLGYITKGPCILCGTEVCTQCNATLADEDFKKSHVCSEDDIKTWTVIKETSKACPKCGTHIQKVSGCNQMWCTATGCNTAFDWATTKIINGPIHNPHYHDWLRLGNPGLNTANANFQCEGPRDIITNIRIREMYDIYNTYFSKSDSAGKYDEMCQWLRSLPEAVDPYYGPRAQDAEYGPQTYENLRIQYLEKSISKSQWASRLSHKETLRIKALKLLSIHTMFQTACADVFLKLHTDSVQAAQAGNLRIKTSTRYIPEMYISVVSLDLGMPILQTFLESMESLRIYTIRETLKVLSDYSDTSTRVLEWFPYVLQDGKKTRHLTWSKVNVETLKDKYT